MNADWDADRLFSSALSRSLSTTYEMGKPWDKRQQTPHPNRLVSNSLQQRPVQEPHHHFLHMYERVASVTGRVTNVTTPVMSITPLLWASHPSNECHALLRACGVWLLQITHVWCLSSYGFLSNNLWYKYIWLVVTSKAPTSAVFQTPCHTKARPCWVNQSLYLNSLKFLPRFYKLSMNQNCKQR